MTNSAVSKTRPTPLSVEQARMRWDSYFRVALNQVAGDSEEASKLVERAAEIADAALDAFEARWTSAT